MQWIRNFVPVSNFDYFFLSKNTSLSKLCLEDYAVIFYFLVAGVDSTKIPGVLGETGLHSMVLDTIRDGNFIFKNTYAENKQVITPINEGPVEFYYLNIELKEWAEKQLQSEMESETSRKYYYH